MFVDRMLEFAKFLRATDKAPINAFPYISDSRPSSTVVASAWNPWANIVFCGEKMASVTTFLESGDGPLVRWRPWAELRRGGVGWLFRRSMGRRSPRCFVGSLLRFPLRRSGDGGRAGVNGFGLFSDRLNLTAHAFRYFEEHVSCAVVEQFVAVAFVAYGGVFH